jgi:LacI family transcriptional regulator
LKGHRTSADACYRWEAIEQVGREMGIPIDPELVQEIGFEDASPFVGYPYGKALVQKGRPFTAFFGYNDVSAIGAIRAFQEAGLNVPRDVSVVGFDDIPAAAFNTPSITTVRQPLRTMGEMAVEILVTRIEGKEDWKREIAVEPEIVIRESTARARP